jgi:hypothetical protein
MPTVTRMYRLLGTTVHHDAMMTRPTVRLTSGKELRAKKAVLYNESKANTGVISQVYLLMYTDSHQSKKK